MNSDELYLAKRIARSLFTDGEGRKATRLLFEFEGDTDGTGWIESAAANQILNVLRGKKEKGARP
jgi:hypothetical protein